MQLTDEENFALNMLLSGSDAASVAVRGQLNRMSVVNRKSTGVGFFSTIHLPLPLPFELQRQWDWNFKHRHLSHGGSFICWMSDPATLELEAVSHNGDWPGNFDVSYFEELG